MRRAELKRKAPMKAKRTRKHIIKPERVSDPERLAWIHTLPCVVCSSWGLIQESPTEAHHLRRRPDGQDYGLLVKAPDTETIPLCSRHHWNGVNSEYTRAQFEYIFDDERVLLEIVNEWRAVGKP